MRGATCTIYYWRLLVYFHLTYQKTIPKIFVLHEMFRCLNSFRGGIGSHSVARGSSSPSFVNLSCVKVGLVLVPPIDFCFVGLPFFPSAPVFPVSLFPLPLTLLLIHARLPDWGRAFVHGHTFLHSWSGPMTLVVGLLHGAAFLSNLNLVLFVSFTWP